MAAWRRGGPGAAGGEQCGVGEGSSPTVCLEPRPPSKLEAKLLICDLKGAPI